MTANDQAELVTRTILFVDDTEDCLASLEIALQAMNGLVLRSARSAEEALSFLSAASIAVLITDVNLPRMDGLELIAHVRADIRYGRLPIIVMSGDTNPETPKRAFALGANAFFAKPYSPSAVRRKLEELIDAR